jgi:protein TonB
MPAHEPVRTAPVLVYRAPANYTEAARRAGVQGSVSLAFDVDESGHAQNVRVVRGLHPDLDRRAAESVLQWRFRPGAADGKPVRSQATAEVGFELANPPSPHAPSLRREADKRR